MSVVLIPIVNLCNQNYILCEIRSDKVPQPGEICLPGGHEEPGESFLDTALRETFEELAIPAEMIHPTGDVITTTTAVHKDIKAVVATVDRQALAKIVRNDDEVAGWFLLPINWLRNHPAVTYVYDEPDAMPEGLKKYLAGYSSRLDGSTLCWDYEGRTVWGLTARIINQYLEASK